MARYIDIHPGAVAVTEEGFRRSFRSRRSIEATEGVRFERSFFDPESGKQFCVCTAPSKEAVLRVHERAGVASPEVYEIAVEAR